MPHDHKHVLATYHKVTEKEVKMAIDAAMKAKHDWMNLPWVDSAHPYLARLLSCFPEIQISNKCINNVRTR